jgi:hypothetical protein
MAVAFTNLPGVFPQLEEGGLSIAPGTRGPRTLVLGTADQGQSHWPYVVQSTSAAASEFGSSGTLTRGMYEVRTAGAENVILYRVGATSAVLTGVGDSTGTAGYTIETLRRDDDAGGIYTIYYDDASDRLVVWNSVSGLVVYDNDSTDPIDLGEVIVSGSRAGGGGPDIAGPSSGYALEDVVSLGHVGTSYTAGTDGASPSRMELYEYYYKAYKDLLVQDFDWVVPMDVYLDDKNIVDGYSFSSTYLSGIVSGGTYPTAAGSDDVLGKIFVEESGGEYYFFWDLNGDGQAELYPDGVGSASATTKIDGTSLSTADFHEANFAYQLARFCEDVSVNNKYCLGGIGVRPPDSLSLADISAWVGKSPTYTTRSDGTQYVQFLTNNGTGLLGNKFKAGSYAYRSGAAYGGLIRTDTEFLDGVEATDSNGYAEDVGKYISVVSAYVRLFNGFDTTGRGYVTTAAPTYIGYASSLDEQVAPTNKVLRTVQRVFDVSARQVDALAGAGYVHIYERPKGMTISDAPTGATPSSDYRRLTTMRICKRTIAAIRQASDPFIGNSFSAAKKAALDTAITQKLDRLVEGGYIQRYVVDIRQTPRQKVIGEATVELILVPAWELRRITLTVALAPQ